MPGERGRLGPQGAPVSMCISALSNTLLNMPFKGEQTLLCLLCNFYTFLFETKLSLQESWKDSIQNSHTFFTQFLLRSTGTTLWTKPQTLFSPPHLPIWCLALSPPFPPVCDIPHCFLVFHFLTLLKSASQLFCRMSLCVFLELLD